ncbi:MAG TPA: hypothetical protein VEZ42_06360 [Pseudonocardia sp.]|nr:hypothetical protein [Pseudonocardia sp.]
MRAAHPVHTHLNRRLAAVLGAVLSAAVAAAMLVTATVHGPAADPAAAVTIPAGADPEAPAGGPR